SDADEVRAQGERVDRIAESLDAATDRLEGIASDQADLTARINSLADSIERASQQDAEMRQGLSDLSNALDQLQARVQALRQGEGEQKEIDREVERRLLLMEAASLLSYGKARVTVGGDVEGAREAYRQADGLVRSAEDPSLSQVRRLLAEELDALENLEVPDWLSLQGRLERQGARVDEWPIVSTGPVETPTDAQAEPDGWIEATRDALGGLVRVSPRAGAELSEHQVQTLREMARLRWLAAELAIARRDSAELDHHLRSLDRLLSQWFDPEADSVQAAARLIDDLQAIEVSPIPANLGQALSALQQALDSA
ncbi:MAG: uroporphyrinogen-III C-methyltransferase, partial [Wenzhouxiangella sp.]|nr:uroporphyrinogen-III C-methyltransferase [Wenzhouxiangella sp.]